jgi:hypothetical protein
MPAKSHGRSFDPIYNVWQRMIARCHKKYSTSYGRYGARGIKVCLRWRASFEAFLADMGERPEGMQLDRYPDNNGNYEPGNVRWATRKQNNRNRRSNRLLTLNGKTQTMTDWAEEYGINASTLHSRLNRDRLSLEEALQRK